MQIFYVQISESAWTLRHTTRTGEATKINKNTIDGSRQLKHAVTTRRFILLPVCGDTLSIVRPHIRRHHTLPSRHLFLRRRHPPFPTPVFTCPPARRTILRTTTSCSRHHLHRFHRSRLDLNTIRRLWCLSVRDRRHFTYWRNWSRFLVSFFFFVHFFIVSFLIN